MNALLPTGTRGARWTGHILAGGVILALLVDAGVSIFAPHLMANDLAHTGFAIALSPVIGGVLLACLVLYAIPRTSVLGAILLTGFLGGAICTHLRIGEVGSPPQIVSALLGIAVWASLYLRLDGLRALLPLTGVSSAR